MTTLPVSLVTTVYNESCTIGSLLDSVAAGSAWPEEIIVVDGGSRDETVARIESWAARHREIPVRLIKNAQRIGIAAGRNMAIRAARSNTIAVIDGGCEAERHWLRKLAEPFSMPDPPDVVAGWYEPRILTAFHARIAQALVPRLSEVDAATFLPSSRSVAFTRRAWDMAGGYPERLRFAGEDTLFD
jgi:glycosyltransferase involved in cell wall biosynthesis